MNGLQQSFVFAVLQPSGFIVQYCWESRINLSNDRLAETAIDLWCLVVEDMCGKVDDCQRVPNEGKSVYDSFDDFGFDLLKIVL